MTGDKPAIIRAGLKGRCPNCFEGRLFSGFLKIEDSCPACGYDFDASDLADGPAVFVILVASILIVPPALAFQIVLDAPLALTFFIFIPLIVIVSLTLLRPFRGAMFAAQIMNDAHEAQLDED